MAFLTANIGAVFVTLTVVLAFLFVWNIVQGYLNDINAPNQVVMFTHPTTVVPTDRVKRASQAKKILGFGALSVGAIIYFGLIRPRFPEFAEALEGIVKRIALVVLTVANDILDAILQWLAE